MNSCGDGELSDGYEVMVDNFTSVGEIEENNLLAIYPNPNNGEFTLELAGVTAGKVDVRVYDITGTIVYHESGLIANTNYSLRIDLGSYPQGMYFVKVSHEQGSSVRKMLLSK